MHIQYNRIAQNTILTWVETKMYLTCGWVKNQFVKAAIKEATLVELARFKKIWGQASTTCTILVQATSKGHERTDVFSIVLNLRSRCCMLREWILSANGQAYRPPHFMDNGQRR